MTADLGESDVRRRRTARHAALEDVRQQSARPRRRRRRVIDARERFVERLRAARAAANALYQGVYPLSAALSRPLIGALLVEAAHKYGADAVAHGCTGKGNDQVRIELGVRALDPHLTVRAPLREAPLSRPDAIAYAPNTAFRSRTPRQSRIRSTPTCGAARSKPACSKIRGTRRPKTRTRGPRRPPMQPAKPDDVVDSLRTRRSVGGRRHRSRIWLQSSTRSPARTASAASTWSKIASSA